MPGGSPEFDEAYKRIFARWTDDAMTGLSAAERDFVIANVCLNQSMNGGLMLYYENSYGERASEAADAFERIGEPGAAALLRRCNALMGPRGASRDREERGRQLEALSDEALEEMAASSDVLNEMEARIRMATLRWVTGRGGGGGPSARTS